MRELPKSDPSTQSPFDRLRQNFTALFELLSGSECELVPECNDTGGTCAVTL